jgi:hypothetical protein
LFKDYQLTLRAYNSLGPGEKSPPVVFTTSEEGKQRITGEKRERHKYRLLYLFWLSTQLSAPNRGEGQFQKRENLEQVNPVEGF